MRVKAAVWIVFCTALTLLGAGYGVRHDWPDFVHVDYGFPLIWATHTLSTIAGPTDTWRVDITHLLIDIMVWQAALILGTAAIEFSPMRARRDLNPRPPG